MEPTGVSIPAENRRSIPRHLVHRCFRYLANGLDRDRSGDLYRRSSDDSRSGRKAAAAYRLLLCRRKLGFGGVSGGITSLLGGLQCYSDATREKDRIGFRENG